MQSKQIIQDAWKFTSQNKSLMLWYALIPSIVSVFSGAIFVIYQYIAFQKTSTASGETIALSRYYIQLVINWFLSNSTPVLIGYIVVAALLALFFYFFYPTFAQGAMIHLIADRRKGENTNLIHGITYGLGSFLPLLEYHLAIKTFSITAVITELTFVLRNLGTDFLRFLLPIFIIIAIIGVFLSLYFTFAEWFIVIDKEKMFSAMKKSASLVFRQWQHTFLILVLLFIIGLRVAVNIVLVLLIPFLLFATLGFFASVAFQSYAIIIGGIVTLVLIYLVGYLGGTLSVFSHAVWTFTFLELTKKEE